METGDAFERLKLIRSSNKSAVWKHFGFIEHGGSFVKCIHCETTLKYSNNTTNFRNHLRSRHRGVFDVMIALERNAAAATTGQNDIESAVGTIVHEVLPQGISYSPASTTANDNEKDTAGNANIVFVGGISSAASVSQDCVSASCMSYEKPCVDDIEANGNESPHFSEGRINRKRKNSQFDLETMAKLMKDYLDYQKESDQQFLEMERQWQEREERLRREDREHSLYMLKLLLAKQQDK